MSVKSETLISVINRIRLLMHGIRTNCYSYEPTILSLRYTARDPRLRFILTKTENNCGELKGGATKLLCNNLDIIRTELIKT